MPCARPPPASGPPRGWSSTRSSSARTPGCGVLLAGSLQFQLQQIDPQPQGAYRVAELVGRVGDQLPLGLDAVADGPRHRGEGTAQFPQFRRPILGKLTGPAGCLELGHCRVQAVDGTQHPPGHPGSTRRSIAASAAAANPTTSHRSRSFCRAASSFTSRTASPSTWLALPKDRDITSASGPKG